MFIKLKKHLTNEELNLNIQHIVGFSPNAEGSVIYLAGSKELVQESTRKIRFAIKKALSLTDKAGES